MPYKLMVVDDQRARNMLYERVLSIPEIEPVFVNTRGKLQELKDTPVDGYLLDVFLQGGDWGEVTAAELLKDSFASTPRSAPVFLVSQMWGDPRVLAVLKEAGSSPAKVVQYLAWSEFEHACADHEDAATRLDALRRKLLFELDRWHGRSGFHPEPNQTVRLLLIADAQFGDPGADPKALFAEHWIAHALDQAKLVPDLLVIAGDLSFSGHPDEYRLASERIERDLMARLWGNHTIDRMRDRVVLVPGNHDVNLRFSACDGYRFDAKASAWTRDDRAPPAASGRSCTHHDYALEPFRRFARDLTGDREWSQSPDLTWVDRRFLHAGFRFFIVNSVAELSAQAPARAAFSEDGFRRVTRSLGKDDGPPVYSIAVSHHGLRPPGRRNDDVEVENWDTVGSDVFTFQKVRLWLFGHYHAFDARSDNSLPFAAAPLWLVQAPSVRMGYETRGFCVVELRREGGKVVDAFVHHFALQTGGAKVAATRRVFDKG